MTVEAAVDAVRSNRGREADRAAGELTGDEGGCGGDLYFLCGAGRGVPADYALVLTSAHSEDDAADSRGVDGVGRRHQAAAEQRTYAKDCGGCASSHAASHKP